MSLASLLRPLLSLLVLGMVVPDGLAMGNGNKKVDVMNCLVRTEADLAGKARGSIRLRRQKKKGDTVSQIDVQALKVAQDQTHVLWLEDAPGSDTFVSLGALTKAGKTLAFGLDTGDGDLLPLDAEALEDLVGLRLEIRVDDDVVLQGRVPPLDLSKKPVKLKQDLVQPALPPAADAKGTLKLRVKADKGQQRFDLKVAKLPFGEGAIHLFVETAPGSGLFDDAGEVDRKGQSSNGRFRRDCKLGDPLPAGVELLADLEGRELQVRDADDAVLLSLVVEDL